MRTFCALFFLLGGPAVAQDTAPRTHALLRGVAVDSLRGGLLRGAVLRVVGTASMGVSDSLGRFQIDSVPAGLHAVELFHEVLDTVGVRVYTEPLAFGPDSAVLLVIGIPSAQTIARAKCEPSAEGQGAIIGMVFGAETEEPLAGVDVRLWWIEVSLGRDMVIHRQPRQHAVLTDAAGRYKFCGLPEDLTAEIRAARGRDSTATVSIGYGESAFAMATLFLPALDPAASGATSSVAGAEPGASLRGLVVDSVGRPVPGARVAIGSSPDAAITDSAGTFTLNGQPSGTQVVVVRRLGYLPAETIVHLSRRVPREVTVRLDVYVPVLEAVLVRARREFALERVGFADRQRSGVGRYFTQADLSKHFVMRVSEYLRRLPPPRAGALTDGCTTYWVDGSRWIGDVDDFMAPEEVAAIEVYSHAFAPAEFTTGFESCRVVVIWTKTRLGVR